MLTAQTAPVALSILEQMNISVVLVDYRSEGIDAEAVAHHVKTRYPHQPVILLSAYADIPERILRLVDEYVMRSEPIERLKQVIERFVGGTKSFLPPAEGLSQELPVAARA